jgi:hypothetical protein
MLAPVPGLPTLPVASSSDAAGAHVRRADGVLGLAHGPDQAGGAILGEHFRDTLELLARHAADALDFLRIPLFDFLADFIHAVDALLDEFLVFPSRS